MLGELQSWIVNVVLHFNSSSPLALESKALLPSCAVPRAMEQSSVTIWGLSAQQLHDAYWRGYGVQCLRQNDPQRESAIDRTADLYLLLEAEHCVVFGLESLIERIVWHGASVSRIKLVEPSPLTYDERIVCDDDGLVQRIERWYGPHSSQSSAHESRRALMTDRPAIAERWLRAQTAREGWVSVRRAAHGRIDRLRISGQSFKLCSPCDEAALFNALVEGWHDPSRVVDGLEQIASSVWKLRRDGPCDAAGLIGPVWLGCGRVQDHFGQRTLNGNPETAGASLSRCIIGPAWLADDPQALAASTHVEGREPVIVRGMIDIELTEPRRTARPRRRRDVYAAAKRVLDVAVSLVVLIVIAPIMLLIALAILIDDGRPVLFRHKRQTRGGRVFNCLKFRTMRRDAEKIVPNLKQLNLCDGPQVYIRNDPRTTSVGRALRAIHLDELPQFWNVLVGEMSLVGPRPSPDRENRYCPAWRELRLSVRPGITGLWQLKRTRSPGQDFQEWIRYDIEYVRKAGFWFDLCILCATAKLFLFGRNKEERQL